MLELLPTRCAQSYTMITYKSPCLCLLMHLMSSRCLLTGGVKYRLVDRVHLVWLASMVGGSAGGDNFSQLTFTSLYRTNPNISLLSALKRSWALRFPPLSLVQLCYRNFLTFIWCLDEFFRPFWSSQIIPDLRSWTDRRRKGSLRSQSYSRHLIKFTRIKRALLELIESLKEKFPLNHPQTTYNILKAGMALKELIAERQNR